MKDIVNQVGDVSRLIHDIDASTQEQAQGVGQVGNAVSQLDRATQENAALVEESAAASDSLSQQATRLVQAVRLFKLEPAATA